MKIDHQPSELVNLPTPSTEIYKFADPFTKESTNLLTPSYRVLQICQPLWLLLLDFQLQTSGTRPLSLHSGLKNGDNYYDNCLFSLKNQLDHQLYTPPIKKEMTRRRWRGYPFCQRRSDNSWTVPHFIRKDRVILEHRLNSSEKQFNNNRFSSTARITVESDLIVTNLTLPRLDPSLEFGSNLQFFFDRADKQIYRWNLTYKIFKRKVRVTETRSYEIISTWLATQDVIQSIKIKKPREAYNFSQTRVHVSFKVHSIQTNPNQDN